MEWRITVVASATGNSFPTKRTLRWVVLSGFLGGGGRAGGRERAIQLLFDQRGILEQPHHFGPHDLIQQVLPDRWVLADGTAEMAPAVRAEAPIVVNRASARTG